MAKKVKPQTKLKEEAGKLLAKVPEENVFWCHDGSVFEDMKELAEGLVAMSDETFAYHVNPEKNDFSKWVKDIINDEKLASELATASTRLEACGCVSARVALLSGKVG